MKLLMHILKKNDDLGIDNRLISNHQIREKLKEECDEVVQELLNYEEDATIDNLKDIVRETYDLIQMCILILWRCHRKAKEVDENNLIKDINIEHKDKLIGERQWSIETGIEIDIKE